MAELTQETRDELLLAVAKLLIHITAPPSPYPERDIDYVSAARHDILQLRAARQPRARHGGGMTTQRVLIAWNLVGSFWAAWTGYSWLVIPAAFIAGALAAMEASEQKGKRDVAG